MGLTKAEKEEKVNEIMELINKIYTAKLGKGVFSYEVEDITIRRYIETYTPSKLDSFINSLKTTQKYISKLKMSGVSLQMVLNLNRIGQNRLNTVLNDINILNNSTSQLVINCGSINKGQVLFPTRILSNIAKLPYSLNITSLDMSIQDIHSLNDMVDVLSSQQTVVMKGALLTITKSHNHMYDTLIYNTQTLDNITNGLRNFIDKPSKLLGYDLNEMLDTLKLILVSKLTYGVIGIIGLEPFENQTTRSKSKGNTMIMLLNEIRNLKSWCNSKMYRPSCYNENEYEYTKDEQSLILRTLKQFTSLCLDPIIEEIKQENFNKYENLANQTPMFKIRYTKNFEKKSYILINNLIKIQKTFQERDRGIFGKI
jgi:hypothetical protein